MAANDPNSPRQKMINLMYLVFIAMLALNVSSEVLDGFELVEESLLRSAKSSTSRNELIFGDLEDYHTTNPEKTVKWYNYAKEVKQKSDSLYNYLDALKLKIVTQSDGEDANPEALEHPDDLNAAFEVMIAPGMKDGKKLKNDIETYRNYISSLLVDSAKIAIVKSNLNTEPSKKAKENKQTWEESMFYQMPLAAAVTLLTKIQNDVRSAEGEALSTLLKNIDVSDFRVNRIEAKVIPKTQIVMKGGSYSADIVLAAIDSTQRPKVFVNGKFLPDDANGVFQTGTGSSGTFPIKGYIEMNRGGSITQYPFESDYYVVEPSATVYPTLMNVLYAGYNNPIDIAVPGVPTQNISATMTNGTLTRNGNVWNAVPSKIGVEAVITVRAKMGDNREVVMANKNYRVRALPDPLAYLEYNDAQGNPIKFRTGKLPKATLIGIPEVKAAVDDDLLRIGFTVLKFETIIFDSMGNTMRDPSDGSRFSQRQKDRIRDLSRGKTFMIIGIVAKGPDGKERLVPAIDITVN